MCDFGQKSNKGIARMVKGGDITLAMVRDIVKQVEPSMFYLGMTEPLLHPRIGQIIDIIKDAGHQCTLTTNGYLLEKKADKLKRLEGIQVSLDGPKGVHDKIRGEGFYDKAVAGIKKVENVYVNYTVTNLNYGCIEEFIEGMQGLGVVQFKIQFMNFVSEQMKAEQNKTWLKQTTSTVHSGINPEQVDTAVLRDQLNRISRFPSVKIIPDTDQIEKYFKLAGEPIERFNTCTLPDGQIAIRPDGKIMFHMRCFDYVIGTVQEGIKKSFNGEKAEKFRQLLREHNQLMPACTRCCGAMQ
jgi:MoaA/NifB/PqqE/SkfB family radical SAM enzyme